MGAGDSNPGSSGQASQSRINAGPAAKGQLGSQSQYSQGIVNRPKSAVVRRPLPGRLAERRNDLKEKKAAMKYAQGGVSRDNSNQRSSSYVPLLPGQDQFRSTQEDRMEELRILDEMNRAMMRKGAGPTQRPMTGVQRADGQGRLGSASPGQRDLSGGQQHRAS